MAKFSDPQAEPTPPPQAAPQVSIPSSSQASPSVSDQVELAKIQLEYRRMEDLKERRDSQSLFRSGWRPTMGWAYICICIFDFILGPFFYAWFAWYTKDFAKFGEWQPLTLQGGGVFHMAMGAINGVTSWTRGQALLVQEKASLPRTPGT